MDFTKFDSVAASEQGADYHLKCAATGKPLFDNDKDPYADNGKPCLITVKGQEAASVREQSRLRQKAKAQEKPSTDDGEDDFVTFDDLHKEAVKIIIPRIIGFKNIRKGKKEIGLEDAEWLLNLNRLNAHPNEEAFVKQLSDFSASRAGFLGNASTA